MRNETEADKKKKPWCDHCKKHWHTRENCWKIHGKPLNWKKKTATTITTDNRALQASSEEQGQQSTLEMSPFTKDQLEHLYKLFQSPNFRVNPSCSFVQTRKLSRGGRLTVLGKVKASIFLKMELTPDNKFRIPAYILLLFLMMLCFGIID